MTARLKPCPFCGGKAYIDRSEKGVATINCQKGSTCIGSGLLVGFMIANEKTAVDQWNRRAPTTDALTPWGIQPDGSGLDPRTVPIHLGGKASDDA